jgi:8-oxo-dGTP diphosphatase
MFDPPNGCRVLRVRSEHAKLDWSTSSICLVFCSSCGAGLASHPPVVCSVCNTEHWRNAKPCAGALVERDGRVLLVRRANDPYRGAWDIPGGFCDGHEHPQDTARREVREETGLDVLIGDLLGIWLDHYGEPRAGEPSTSTLNIYYLAKARRVPQLAIDPDEVLEVGWFDRDELPSDLAFPDHAGAVLDAWRRRATGLPGA